MPSKISFITFQHVCNCKTMVSMLISELHQNGDKYNLWGWQGGQGFVHYMI